MYRVVVKNERGERVLDTLTKQDDPDLEIGQKQKQIRDFSIQKAPSMQQVQAYLREIFKGRKLVGYHIEMKLNDLELLDELDSSLLYDSSKMFNDHPVSGQQWSMVNLCKEFLNMNYKKPSSNVAVSL